MEKHKFCDFKWLRYTKNYKNKIFYKTVLNEDSVFNSISTTRRNSLQNNNTSIPKSYNNILPITEEKKKDLLPITFKIYSRHFSYFLSKFNN